MGVAFNEWCPTHSGVLESKVSPALAGVTGGCGGLEEVSCTAGESHPPPGVEGLGSNLSECLVARSFLASAKSRIAVWHTGGLVTW